MRKEYLVIPFIVLFASAAIAIPPESPGTKKSGNIIVTKSNKALKIPQHTVATLPTLTASESGAMVQVTDGADTSDCTVGGGAGIVTCRWSGSAWASIGDGVGAGTASGTVSTLDGTGDAGVAATHSRGDHKHAVTPAGIGAQAVLAEGAFADGDKTALNTLVGAGAQNVSSTGTPSLASITATGASGIDVGVASTTLGLITLQNNATANAFSIFPGATGVGVGWRLPIAAPGGDNYLLNADADGTMDYTNPATFLTPTGDGSGLSGVVTSEVDPTVDTDDEIIAIINASPSTQIGVPAGGTGAGTFTDGGLLVGAGTGALEALAVGLTTQVLVGGGAGTNPAWGTDLPTAVTIGSAYIYRVGGTDVVDADVDDDISAYRQYIPVRKGSAGTITIGQPVYQSGYNVGGWIEVELADNNGSGTMPCIGLAAESITNAATANVISFGILSGIDTSSYSVNDHVYVDATAGQLTSTRPSASTSGVQAVGTVTRSNVATGAIFVDGAGRVNDVPNIFPSEVTAAIGGIEFQETDTLTDCSTYAATGGGIFYDDSEGKFKKCQDNVLTDLDTDTGGATAYSAIGDPTGVGLITFDDGETATYDGAWDTEVAITISLNAADLTGDTTGLLITAVDNDDANYIPLLIQDDQDGTPDDLFKVDYQGVATATGGFVGNVTGNVSGTAATVTGAAQAAITSLGTLTTLTVDDITINGNTISSAGASTLAITPTAGQTITLDGTITIDAGVVAGATSITSTTFVGNLTGNASGSAASITGDLDPDQLSGDTTDDNLVDQDIIEGMATTGVTTPGFTAYDSDLLDSDKTAGAIYWNGITLTAGAEDVDFFIQTMQGGALTEILTFDESDDRWETTKAFLSSGAISAGAGVDLGTSQALTGTTAMTIGNNGQTVAINSSDWDIDATGVMTGIGNITSDGTITSSGAFDVTGATGMDLGSADVTDITMLGQSEDLAFTPSADTWTLSSSTGVTSIGFSALNINTTGVIKGRASYGADITGAIGHNTTDTHAVFYHFTAAATVTLDAAADAGYGAQVCYRVRDAAEAAVIDVDVAEKINLAGTALAAGTAITATGAGESICMVATTDTDGAGTDGWEAWGPTSGWASQ